MKSSKAVLFVTLSIAGSAFAQSKMDKPAAAAVPAAGAPDMTKMGPWTRKPTAEKQTKKEIMDFIAQMDALCQKGEFEGMINKVDFPVYMITDDAKGTPEDKAMNRQQYTAMMKPFFENKPKDMKVTHKPNIVVLSDSLVNVTDEFTMTMGGTKMSGRSASLLVKRDGEWKWKSMTEAGWGGMSAPTAAMPSHPAAMQGRK